MCKKSNLSSKGAKKQHQCNVFNAKIRYSLNKKMFLLTDIRVNFCRLLFSFLSALLLVLSWQGLLGLVHTPKIVHKYPNVRIVDLPLATKHNIRNIPTVLIKWGMIFTLVPDACTGNTSYFMVALLHSAVDNFRYRDKIRTTWGQVKHSRYGNLTVIFVLGQTLNATSQLLVEEESRKHNDILQGQFMDTYHNLTLKHLSLMQWALEHCSQWTNWFLKGDDDIVVNIFKLVPYLIHPLTPKHDVLLCYVIKNPLVWRQGGKHNISDLIYPASRWPDFCSGQAYVISVDAADRILHQSMKIPPIFIDDAFVTGVTRLQTGIKLLRVPRQFQHRHYTIMDSNPAGVFFKLSPDRMPIFGTLASIDNTTDELDMMSKIWDIIIKYEDKSKL